MNNFLVRVELYGAEYDDYERFHEIMLELKLYRHISQQGKTLKLPDGTYFGAFNATAHDVLVAVRKAAKNFSPDNEASIFVCNFTDYDHLLYQA
ncbi:MULTISPECIES: hypothetical protein [Photorhabdus]|uniref:DUF2622 domain-containing protein n=1 Tax=Photorhabdus hindustanensis TaxID=2918802 RepID=A0A2S8PU30_9GAMM|nr:MULTISPECIES: hypothetical protein [Photorhabdus]PQQ22306.1 hypothetical protein C6H66_24070 [Photorhabdus hindustanensis]